MIEDEAFLLEGTGDGLFGNGEELLKLDETDALPMMYRCIIIRGSVLEVDVRFDRSVVRGLEMEAFVNSFEKNLGRLSHGCNTRSVVETLSL